MELKGKRLLVIGGSMATYAIVQNAKEMGVYTIVADASDKGEAYKIADEAVQVSTADINGLARIVYEKQIDGIFCGPSEFNIQNTMKLAEKTGLRFYATKELWDKCGDKTSLKYYCKICNLPCIPEFSAEDEQTVSNIPDDEFPLIVKPVDGCSSKGVTVCHNKNDLKKALSSAVNISASGNAIIEKYIDNGGSLFSFRYILDGDNAYPYLLMDTYIADPSKKKSLISAFSIAPSKYTELYMESMDKSVRAMLQEMGLQHGVVFAQSLPYKDKFYCHDMGYRLSGGMVYRMTQELSGINDMKMMIRYALGGEICTEEEKNQICLNPKNKVVAQLMIPLNAGTIASIKGVEAIQKEKNVIQYIQYYQVGDTVKPEVIGTLGQHFGRVSFCTETREELVEIVNRILNLISITDEQGNEMFTMRFDTNRLYS